MIVEAQPWSCNWTAFRSELSYTRKSGHVCCDLLTESSLCFGCRKCGSEAPGSCQHHQVCYFGHVTSLNSPGILGTWATYSRTVSAPLLTTTSLIACTKLGRLLLGLLPILFFLLVHCQ